MSIFERVKQLERENTELKRRAKLVGMIVDTYIDNARQANVDHPAIKELIKSFEMVGRANRGERVAL